MKTKIQNRAGESISVLIDVPQNAHGLAFVAHGLGGFKEQSHMAAFAEVLNEQGYITVRWDARKTNGESDGALLDATVTNYFEDFETVINWAATQDWYKEPFIVCGHSLGSACALLYTLKHPEKVSALIPTSAFVSGKAYEATNPQQFIEWKEKGFHEWISSSRPGVVKRLKWGFMEDAYKYNLLEDIYKITAPTLLIVGSQDSVTLKQTQEDILHLLGSEQKELQVIEGSEHTFTKPEHLEEIKKIVKQWLVKQA